MRRKNNLTSALPKAAVKLSSLRDLTVRSTHPIRQNSTPNTYFPYVVTPCSAKRGPSGLFYFFLPKKSTIVTFYRLGALAKITKGSDSI